MNTERGCRCHCPLESVSEITEYVYEEEEPTFDVIADIWREKMIKSKLFVSSEVEVILPIWLKFVEKVIQTNTGATADEFYMSTATVCAYRLKHYCENGWQCLIMDYPPTILRCNDDSSLEEQEVREVREPSVYSDESTSDIHTQVEFLIQLVASSNICLFLVRLAFDKNFTPNYKYAKSPNNLCMPRNYFVPTALDGLETEEVRKNLLDGVYDGVILPLQMATEVSDNFWETEIAEINSLPRFSRTE